METEDMISVLERARREFSDGESRYQTVDTQVPEGRDSINIKMMRYPHILNGLRGCIESDKVTKEVTLEHIDILEKGIAMDMEDCRKQVQEETLQKDWIPVDSNHFPKKTGDYLCTVEWYGTSTKELLEMNGHPIEKKLMMVHYLDSTHNFQEVSGFCRYKVLAWKEQELYQDGSINEGERD